MSDSLLKHRWWSYINEDLRELLKASALLSDRVGVWREKFHDYSFIVFPAAKAYEGFLKTLFRDLGFISDDDFFGKRFRIGKALNPALDSQFRESESVYDRLEYFCHSKELPDTLWNTWKNGRNMLFHWFPNEKNAISYNEAKEMLNQILVAMDLAFEGCKIK